eukprot:jgi/Mesvir1/22538/Mv18557-RA.1
MHVSTTKCNMAQQRYNYHGLPSPRRAATLTASRQPTTGFEIASSSRRAISTSASYPVSPSVLSKTLASLILSEPEIAARIDTRPQGSESFALYPPPVGSGAAMINATSASELSSSPLLASNSDEEPMIMMISSSPSPAGAAGLSIPAVPQQGHDVGSCELDDLLEQGVKSQVFMSDVLVGSEPTSLSGQSVFGDEFVAHTPTSLVIPLNWETDVGNADVVDKSGRSWFKLKRDRGEDACSVAGPLTITLLDYEQTSAVACLYSPPPPQVGKPSNRGSASISHVAASKHQHERYAVLLGGRGRVLTQQKMVILPRMYNNCYNPSSRAGTPGCTPGPRISISSFVQKLRFGNLSFGSSSNPSPSGSVSGSYVAGASSSNLHGGLGMDVSGSMVVLPEDIQSAAVELDPIMLSSPQSPMTLLAPDPDSAFPTLHFHSAGPGAVQVFAGAEPLSGSTDRNVPSATATSGSSSAGGVSAGVAAAGRSRAIQRGGTAHELPFLQVVPDDALVAYISIVGQEVHIRQCAPCDVVALVMLAVWCIHQWTASACLCGAAASSGADKR